jgi:hypothetical protein
VELNLLSPGVEIDGFIFRLVHLYALTGDIESALRVSARIQDPFIRVSAFIDSARFALLNGKTSDGFDILDKSMNQAQNETRYRDRLYSDLSTAYLVGADLNRAVAAAGRIGAPYALGIAVAEVAAFTLSNRTILPEEALARLQTLFSK